MLATSYDTLHKIITVTVDKEELERIAYFLNEVSSRFTDKATSEARQKAIEILEIVIEMHNEEMRQYKETLKDMRKRI